MTNITEALFLDFTEIPNDDSSFEMLIEELFREMGYNATRTGKGPDSGCDIIATSVTHDKIFGLEERRMVIQCKHYAHSNKAVRLDDILNIIETLTQFRAKSYLLITSTEITSALQTRFDTLRTAEPRIRFEYWDKGLLRKHLLDHPTVILRHFPYALRQNVIRMARPKNKIQNTCYEHVLTHIKQYVGAKFIPNIYIARAADSKLLDGLASPYDIFETGSQAYQSFIINAGKHFANLCYVPPYAYVAGHQEVFEWKIRRDRLDAEQARVVNTLLGLKYNLQLAYSRGGSQAVSREVQLMRSNLSRIREDLRNVYNEYILPAQWITSEERQNQRQMEALDKRIQTLTKDILELKREGAKKTTSGQPTKKRKTLGKLEEERQLAEKELSQATRLPAWKRANALYPQTIGRPTQAPAAKDKLPFEEVLARILQYLDKPFTEQFTNPEKTVHPVTRSVQVLVDVAGSGKTNLCCRLALQQATRYFVMFVTGRFISQSGLSLEAYMLETLNETFPERGRLGLEQHIFRLYSDRYPLLVILDGINEAADYGKMSASMERLLRLCKSTPMRAIVSSRSDYWVYFERLFSGADTCSIIAGEISRFAENEHEIAIPVYLHHYHLHGRIEGEAWEQLRRPLLLRFFCEAYGNTAAPNTIELPPIREVRLLPLFDRYCSVKFENIASQLALRGHSVTSANIEDFVSKIAMKLSEDRDRLLTPDLLTASGEGREMNDVAIYRALLDEDIIIEEGIQLGTTKARVRHVFFVYEAFEEYILAKSLLRLFADNEVQLVRWLSEKYSQHTTYSLIWGIGTYLYSMTPEEFKKSRDLIVAQLLGFGPRQFLLQTLLNAWDKDFGSYIWPLLMIPVERAFELPFEDIRKFLKECIAQRQPYDFVSVALMDPEHVRAVLGEDAAGFVLGIDGVDRRVLVKLAVKMVESTWPRSAERLLERLLFSDYANCDVFDSEMISVLTKELLPTMQYIANRLNTESCFVLEAYAQLLMRIGVEAIPTNTATFRRLAGIWGKCFESRTGSQLRYWRATITVGKKLGLFKNYDLAPDDD